MATKIIHVLKSDTFEEVMAELKGAEADEVIFIFPKSSKFEAEETNFEELKSLADKKKKNVTIMGGHHLETVATEFGFHFVPSQVNEKTVESKSEIEETLEAIDDEVEEQQEEDTEVSFEVEKELEEEFGEDTPIEETDFDDPQSISEPAVIDSPENESEAVAQLAASRAGMTDIIPPNQGDRSLKIKKEGVAKRESVPLAVLPQPGEKYSPKALIETERDKMSKAWLGRFYKKSNGDDNLRSKSKKVSPPKKKRGILWFVIGALIVLALIIYSTFGEAKVIVTPKTQQLDFQIDASTSSRFSRVDTSFNTIPGEFFSIEKSGQETIKASGQKEVSQKARGKITVFNESGTEPQRLVATTRFETTDGLIFRTPEAITVPGAKVSDGKIVEPGKIEIEVIADQPGENYNVASGRLTIPGFKGSDKFDKFYATPNGSFSGGIVGLANIVTQSDLDKIETTLSSKLKSEVAQAVTGQSRELTVIDSVEPEIIEKTFSHKVGEATDEVSLTLTLRVATIAFRENDAIALVDQFIQKTGDLELVKSALNIDYQNPKIDKENETLDFTMKVTGRAGVRIDTEILTQKLIGLREAAIREVINQIQEIESARIILSPFWVKRIPEDPNKVKVEISYE